MIVTSHGTIHAESCRGTPQKINNEPENDGLEDDFPLPGVHSQIFRGVPLDRTSIQLYIHLKMDSHTIGTLHVTQSRWLFNLWVQQNPASICRCMSEANK